MVGGRGDWRMVGHWRMVGGRWGIWGERRGGEGGKVR